MPLLFKWTCQVLIITLELSCLETLFTSEKWRLLGWRTHQDRVENFYTKTRIILETLAYLLDNTYILYDRVMDKMPFSNQIFKSETYKVNSNILDVFTYIQDFAAGRGWEQWGWYFFTLEKSKISRFCKLGNFKKLYIFLNFKGNFYERMFT